VWPEVVKRFEYAYEAALASGTKKISMPEGI
jgi:hypothetical protein